MSKIDQDQFVENFGNRLTDYGFQKTNGGSSYYRNTGGTASCVVYMCNFDGNYAKFWNEFMLYCSRFSSDEARRRICLEFVVLDAVGNFENYFADVLPHIAHSSGIVCDVSVVDFSYLNGSDSDRFYPTIKRLGGGKYYVREVEKALGKSYETKKAKTQIYRETTGGSRKILIALMIANFAIFILGLWCEASTGVNKIVMMGIQNNELILRGQWWRLITAMFLHADVSHIVCNMLSLSWIGRLVLQKYTGKQFLWTYFIGGLCGNILSLFFVRGNSLGASGAIMTLSGVVCFWLIFSEEREKFRAKGNFMSFIGVTALNLFYGIIANTNINNWAHWGGFLAGMIIAFIIEKRLKEGQKNGKN